MSTINIESKIRLSNRETQKFDTATVKNEPMLYQASALFAINNGGPITKDFLRLLMDEFESIPDNLIIDSRVHMFVAKGSYPCIPGWHHDDVPRNTSSGQPNYIDPEYRSEHALCLYGDDVCRTEFALGSSLFTIPDKDKVIYKEWHPIVQSMVDNGSLTLFKAPMHKLVFFDDRTWHQGVQNTGVGWRFFIRATWNTNRKPANEIRRQVQIYTPIPFEGW